MLFDFFDFLNDGYYTIPPQLHGKLPNYVTEKRMEEMGKTWGEQLAQLQKQIDECREDINLLYKLYDSLKTTKQKSQRKTIGK